MSERANRALANITERLKKMTKEDRLAWFADDSLLKLQFMKEISGTTYIARCHFGGKSDESMIDKTQRIILKMNDPSN